MNGNFDTVEDLVLQTKNKLSLCGNLVKELHKEYIHTKNEDDADSVLERLEEAYSVLDSLTDYLAR